MNDPHVDARRASEARGVTGHSWRERALDAEAYVRDLRTAAARVLYDLDQNQHTLARSVAKLHRLIG